MVTASQMDVTMLLPTPATQRTPDHFAVGDPVYFGLIHHQTSSESPVRFVAGTIVDSCFEGCVTFQANDGSGRISCVPTFPWILPEQDWERFRHDPIALDEWLDSVRSEKTGFNADDFRTALLTG